MNVNFLSGITTALITPFNKGKVDYPKLEEILSAQVSAKVSSILLFGTTAEPYSLSLSEKKSIFLLTKRIAPNIPIIAGISHPSTDECIKEAKRLINWGANALMITTPYFYKTLERGTVAHFEKIASCTSLPIIVYNVPNRTGYDISIESEVLKMIDNIENIVAIKQASNVLSICKDFLTKTNKLSLCGNDSYLFELLKCGYHGVISVLSNAFPQKIVQIYNSMQKKDFSVASSTFNEVYPLITALEKYPNPIGIKYLCSKVFNLKNELRLPLVKLNTNESKKIDFCLNNLLGE
ncbi:MAG: 4-hydroxy-tetrahydrodipicolinate synthase [Clostridia bacterium]|nr:4-hydroxy-tetrahydrodipicolinate synthase [Clostridia bacterium]